MFFSIKTYSELWKATRQPSPLLVVVFEESAGSLVGPQVCLKISTILHLFQRVAATKDCFELHFMHK